MGTTKLNSIKLKGRSGLEQFFMMVWKSNHFPYLTPEYKFHPLRKWRFDFANIPAMVAIEVEGLWSRNRSGGWGAGRHTRPAGFMADCDKYYHAALQGWTVFRLTKNMIDDEHLTKIARFLIKRLEQSK